MIKLLITAALMLAGAAFSVPTSLGHSRALKNRAPLSAEQRNVYNALLSQPDSAWKKFSEGDSVAINLVNLTIPLNLDEKDECVKGIDFENLRQARKSLHRLGTDIELGRDMRLVDTTQEAALTEAIRQGLHGANLLKISEIGFDKTHEYAVTSYVFSCGILCGNTETVVFRRIGQKWGKANRKCKGLVF